jgi:hypothetical protein
MRARSERGERRKARIRQDDGEPASDVQFCAIDNPDCEACQ